MRDIKIGLEIGKKPQIISNIIDPALNQEVHLILLLYKLTYYWVFFAILKEALLLILGRFYLFMEKDKAVLSL